MASANDWKTFDSAKVDIKKQDYGDAEIDEATDLLDMLKKIEIKFFELYEKRKKVYLGASKKEKEEVKAIEDKLKSNRQAEKM